uniref:Uncharacterized protein n=1 Tax=Timema bartmani TaxID=61472 RepID=A0A7R9I5J6_9NEOP|nr:unnamed protein product [Timema bartmani]
MIALLLTKSLVQLKAGYEVEYDLHKTFLESNQSHRPRTSRSTSKELSDEYLNIVGNILRFSGCSTLPWVFLKAYDFTKYLRSLLANPPPRDLTGNKVSRALQVTLSGSPIFDLALCYWGSRPKRIPAALEEPLAPEGTDPRFTSWWRKRGVRLHPPIRERHILITVRALDADSDPSPTLPTTVICSQIPAMYRLIAALFGLVVAATVTHAQFFQPFVSAPLSFGSPQSLLRQQPSTHFQIAEDPSKPSLQHRAVVLNSEAESRLPSNLQNPFYKDPRITAALAKESWFTPGEEQVREREAEKIPRSKIYSIIKNAGFVRR